MNTLQDKILIRMEDESIIFNQIVSDFKFDNIIIYLENYMQEESFYIDPEFSFY